MPRNWILLKCVKYAIYYHPHTIAFQLLKRYSYLSRSSRVSPFSQATRITLLRLRHSYHVLDNYRVILKKVIFGIFRTFLASKEEKKFYYRKQRQRAISEQVLMTFGQCQNHQN